MAWDGGGGRGAGEVGAEVGTQTGISHMRARSPGHLGVASGTVGPMRFPELHDHWHRCSHRALRSFEEALGACERLWTTVRPTLPHERPAFDQDARYRGLMRLAQNALGLHLLLQSVVSRLASDELWRPILVTDPRDGREGPVDAWDAMSPRFDKPEPQAWLANASMGVVVSWGATMAWYGIYERGLRALSIELKFVEPTSDKGALKLGTQLVQVLPKEQRADWLAHLQVSTAVRDSIHHGGVRRPTDEPVEVVYREKEFRMEPGRPWTYAGRFLVLDLLRDAIRGWEAVCLAKKIQDRRRFIPDYVIEPWDE